jgi:hypothetical protein
MFFFIEKNKSVDIIYIIYNMEVNTSTTTDPINMYNYMNNIMINPVIFIVIFRAAYIKMKC